MEHCYWPVQASQLSTNSRPTPGVSDRSWQLSSRHPWQQCIIVGTKQVRSDRRLQQCVRDAVSRDLLLVASSGWTWSAPGDDFCLDFDRRGCVNPALSNGVLKPATWHPKRGKKCSSKLQTKRRIRNVRSVGTDEYTCLSKLFHQTPAKFPRWCQDSSIVHSV